jgi:carbon storage regulator
MLVLSRKPGEEVVIGDNIRLTVVAVHGSQVRLGITAPIEMPVRRQELGRNGPHIPGANGVVDETSS